MKIEHEQEYRDYMAQRGDGVSADDYVSRLHRVQRELDLPELSPRVLPSLEVADALVARLREKGIRTTDLKPALHRYVECISTNGIDQQALDLTDAAEPERRETVVHRIIRDTAMVRSLKRRYHNLCQICKVAVELGAGRTYSEGHHIRPLGQPHKGTDTPDNILILCPNHHAQCDYRAIKLALASLYRLPDHAIDEKHIEYHNSLCGQLSPET